MDIQVADEGCYVFQWDNVTHIGGGGPWTMEAILYEDSYEIVYQIGAGNPEQGSGSTTGLQDGAITTGLTYACDTVNSIPDNTAVCNFDPRFPPNGFISFTTTVPALGSGALIIPALGLGFVAFRTLRKRAA